MEAGRIPFLVFVARRLLWAVFLLFVASVLVFVVFWLVPANPAAIRPASPFSSPKAQADARHFLQLDLPIWHQYVNFVWRTVRYGSLGRSYVSRRSVDSMIGADAPVTGSLILGSAVIWLLVAIPLGIYAAVRPRSLADRTSTILILLGLSAHPVWIGLTLSYIFGYRLGWVPIQGYCNFFHGGGAVPCFGASEWAVHLLLPWITFSALFAALYLRLIRATVLENMTHDYVRTARAKGATEWRVVMVHVVRNSLIPVITIFGMDLGLAFGASIFTENIFALPGLGNEILRAYRLDDYPVLIGVIMFAAVCIVLLNLVVDIAYGWLEPHTRYS
ncbi:MAG TPA: ABC transporter permease [Gaiellaceae bacterium]